MSTQLQAVIAANRFGLGARPREVAQIQGDVAGWLNAQIKPQAPLGSVQNAARRYASILAGVSDPKEIGEAIRKAVPLYRQDIVLRVTNAVTTKAPFVERLVQFWSNHLAVSLDRPPVTPFALPYENEAIRPYIFGRLEDMVLASARHPAMLLYLDNVRSIGPNSPAAQKRNRAQQNNKTAGLNENYAREVMELHTLGVDGGYTQTDVRNLAKILTGWGMDRDKGVFAFHGPAHEPGAQTVLGQSFDQSGEAQGVAALRYISRHPSTAKHIATKLARHFIADEPPADAVAALAQVYSQTGGDLAAVTRKLISLEAAWQDRPLKFKSPYEHVVSSLRLCGVLTVDEGILASFEALGQRIFSPPSPQGWPDVEGGWLSGTSLIRRIEWSQAMAARMPTTLDARKLAGEALGPWLSGDTAFMLQGAPSPQAALALLFLSPEFQRR